MLPCPCNEYPFTTHFYIVKLGLHYFLFFSFFGFKTALEPPQSMFLAKILKKKKITEKCHFYSFIKFFKARKHGQETRDYSASFPFLNRRPPLPISYLLLGISVLI